MRADNLPWTNFNKTHPEIGCRHFRLEMNIYKILLVTSRIYYDSPIVNYIKCNEKRVISNNSRLSSLDHIPLIYLGG